MSSKDIVKAILDGKRAERVGFWAGIPTDEAEKIYFDYFKVNNRAALNEAFENDLNHVWADGYMWPFKDRPVFDFYGGKKQMSLNQPGVFAECESVAEVEAFDWPDPKVLTITPLIEEIGKETYKNKAVFSGLLSVFFHDLCSFFGMDNYFVKMHTNPDVVEAVTERVVNFYLEANKKCFEQVGSKIDAFFLANDFGSQESLLVSPDCFKKYILPGFKKLIDLAKSFDLKVVLHSCGSIAEVIPMLIDAGIDALHPLQAKAKGMDAETLAGEYKKDIAFIGGVDTQQLLPFGTPEQVKAEVRRLKKVFGERFIVSPSHEAILPIVNPENIIAMREAAME